MKLLKENIRSSSTLVLAMIFLDETPKNKQEKRKKKSTSRATSNSIASAQHKRQPAKGNGKLQNGRKYLRTM